MMKLATQFIGNIGENIATAYLKDKGYAILANNFYTRFGELDIIGKKDQTIVFFEVKTRKSLEKGQPHESINLRKLKHLKRAISYFLLTNKFADYKLRLDVIAIVLNTDNSVDFIKHFENVEI